MRKRESFTRTSWLAFLALGIYLAVASIAIAQSPPPPPGGNNPPPPPPQGNGYQPNQGPNQGGEQQPTIKCSEIQKKNLPPQPCVPDQQIGQPGQVDQQPSSGGSPQQGNQPGSDEGSNEGDNSSGDGQGQPPKPCSPQPPNPGGQDGPTNGIFGVSGGDTSSNGQLKVQCAPPPHPPAPQMARGFLNRVMLFSGDVDGYEDGVLNMTIKRLPGLPKAVKKKFDDEVNAVIGEDAYVLIDKAKIVDSEGNRVSRDDVDWDSVEAAKVKGKVIQPSKWKKDPDDTPVLTIRAKKVLLPPSSVNQPGDSDNGGGGV